MEISAFRRGLDFTLSAHVYTCVYNMCLHVAHFHQVVAPSSLTGVISGERSLGQDCRFSDYITHPFVCNVTLEFSPRPQQNY